jgi:hypothetical protein
LLGLTTRTVIPDLVRHTATICRWSFNDGSFKIKGVIFAIFLLSIGIIVAIVLFIGFL